MNAPSPRPRVDDDRRREILNLLRVDPDPDELQAAYLVRPGARRTRSALAVLGQLQLAAEHREFVDMRRLGLRAGVDPATVCRVVGRLRTIGVVDVEGGELRWDAAGHVTRSCLRYRLRWSPAMPMSVQHGEMADTFAWATSAGVSVDDAVECVRAGRRGVERLELKVRCAELERARLERKAREERERAEAELGRYSRTHTRGVQVGVAHAGAASVGEALAGVLARHHLMQHGAPSSNQDPAEPNCNESRESSSPRGSNSRASRIRANAAFATTENDGAALEAMRDVLAYAQRVRATSALAHWHVVQAAAAEHGVPLGRAVTTYIDAAAEASYRAHHGRLRKGPAGAAGWAIKAFQAHMRELEAA